MTRLGAPRITVVAVCFVMAVFAWGTVFYGHSVYMEALTRENGWSTGLVSTAVLVFWIASLPGTMSVGLLIDRRGPGPVLLIGALCIGLGLIALGSVREPWQMFVVYAVLGFGYPAVGAAAISATLAPWFERGFGAALGVALTGASVGGALLPVVIVRLSEARGFDVAMPMVGGVLLTILMAAALILFLAGRRRPVSASGPAGVAPRTGEVLRDPLFWRLSVGAALALGAQVGFLAHQVPIVAERTDALTASFTVTIVAICSAIGRLMVAQASRHVATTTLAALCYIAQAAGIAILALGESLLVMQIGCAVAGLVVGAIVMLPPMLVREAFGVAGYGRIYAMVNVVLYVLAGLGPWMVGTLRDALDAYAGGLLILVAFQVVAVAMIARPLRRA